MLRRSAIIITAALIALGVIFAIGEIFARLIYKQSYLMGFTRPDPVFHHIPPPYFKGDMTSPGDFLRPFTTNNRGMRGPGDYAYEKKDGTVRIAVLGDSFTFGVGVKADETVPYVLERLLNGAEDKRYEVYNFGVNSYSPILEHIYLKKEVVKYSPDMVILMLDICDIQDDFYYEPHIVRGASGDIIGCDPFRVNNKPDIKALGMKYSRLLYMIDYKLLESLRKIKTIGVINYFSNKFKGIRNKTEILTNKDIDNIYFDRFLLVREGKDPEIVRRHWERTAKYILMIKKYLDQRNIKFILATYPYGYQVGKDQWSKGRTYWGFEKGKVYDSRKGFAIIDDFAKRNGIGFISLYDGLTSRKDEPLYYNSDGHWTRRGQEIVAYEIFNSVVFQNALKKER